MLILFSVPKMNEKERERERERERVKMFNMYIKKEGRNTKFKKRMKWLSCEEEKTAARKRVKKK